MRVVCGTAPEGPSLLGCYTVTDNSEESTASMFSVRQSMKGLRLFNPEEGSCRNGRTFNNTADRGSDLRMLHLSAAEIVCVCVFR